MRVAIVAKPKRVRLVLVLGICGFLTGTANAVVDEELFGRCLRGSDDAQARLESKRACTQYLSILMGDTRIGIVTDKERKAPFCLPARDLTTQEINFMFARIKADIRGIIRDNMDDIIAGVVLNKAYRCGH
jgi:hypothetical protein